MASKSAAQNTLMNWGSLVVTSLLSFVIRTYLIRYLGYEILGVNATIVETVNLLSMSELGIQTSISYKMYKPIVEGDIRRQSELFNLYKVAYRMVGLAIIFIGVILFPFLERLVNTNIDMNIVYVAYILQVGSIALTYFMSYYRIIFLTHQKQYICTRYDIFVSILTLLLQIVTLVRFKSYLLYLSVNYIGSFVGYVLVLRRTRKEYPSILEKRKIKKEDISALFRDLKEMLIGTFSGCIYGSTDNILISFFFGSVTTGLISNYKMVTQIMRRVVSSANTAVSPTWGDFLYRVDQQETTRRYYKSFIFIEYCACMLLLIPTLVLIDDFIELWLGSGFIINRILIVLIIVDVFFTNLNEPACVIIRNLGMFKEEKVVSTIAATANIVTSVFLAKLIGVAGIFAGTLIAVCVYWGMRSYYVNKRCFLGDKKNYLTFWIDNLMYVISFIVVYKFLRIICSMIDVQQAVLNFILKGVVCEVFIVLFICIIWHKTERFGVIKEKIIGIIRKIQ